MVSDIFEANPLCRQQQVNIQNRELQELEARIRAAEGRLQQSDGSFKTNNSRIGPPKLAYQLIYICVFFFFFFKPEIANVCPRFYLIPDNQFPAQGSANASSSAPTANNNNRESENRHNNTFNRQENPEGDQNGKRGWS